MPSGRLVHISDIHFGRISDPAVVDGLVEDIAAFGPEAVVISGDLTQRSRPKEWAQARQFVARLRCNWIAVPGNHDVWPWWHPVSRLHAPVARYQTEFDADLEPSLETPTFAIIGLNSAHGRTVKSGKLTEPQIAGIRGRFQHLSPDRVRVLVVHHPPVKLLGASNADVLAGGADMLSAASDAGVRLVLCGHLHRSQWTRVGSQLVVAAGTATSNRSREPEGPDCRYFRIWREDGRCVVGERRWEGDSGFVG